MFPFDDVIVTRNARCYLIYSTELWIKHQIYQNCPDSRTKSTNTDDTGPILLFQHKVVFIEEIWHMMILSDLATYIKRQESKIRQWTNYARYSSTETGFANWFLRNMMGPATSHWTCWLTLLSTNMATNMQMRTSRAVYWMAWRHCDIETLSTILVIVRKFIGHRRISHTKGQ